MKRSILALGTTMAVILAALNIAAAKEWKQIRIGVEGAYPPFSEIDGNGELAGFDIDIARALCEQMNAECALVQQDWDGIIPALLARKYDAIIASMSITPERDERVDFTDKYYDTYAKFAAPKNSDIQISRKGLTGKTVGVQRATIYDRFLTDRYSDILTIRRYRTQDDVYLDAQAGRIDLFMADKIAVQLGFLQTKAGQDWHFVGPDFREPEELFGEGVAIAVRESDDDLRRQFNAAIDAILANGTYRRIQDKYFDFNVYGEPHGPDS